VWKGRCPDDMPPMGMENGGRPPRGRHTRRPAGHRD
jgi:hypothetical protein